MSEHDAEFDLRSYGRRRGRKLSARQDRLMREMLPRLAMPVGSPPPADVVSLFPVPVREVWLEIGFGGGEHLLWQAQQNPGCGFIGCEPFEDGVVKVLTAIEDRHLANIRLHADDARTVLRWLPPSSIARAFVLFPDPWPKARHRKRRLLNDQTLALLARVMTPGGHLRVATDIGDYLRTILMAFQRSPDFRWLAARPGDWRVRPGDWPATRYEQKALREGRRSTYLTFERT
jgi:tRNA (guanine-N7-)-methyltransferase